MNGNNKIIIIIINIINNIIIIINIIINIIILRKNFLKPGLKLKTTFWIALDKNIQTRKFKKIIAWKNT